MASYTFKKSNINPRALNQTKTWYDRKGREYDISNMSKQHCLGAMGKLIDAFGNDAMIKPLFNALMDQAKK